MGLRDLLAANAALHLDPDHGFAETFTHQRGATQTEFSGVLDESDLRGLTEYQLNNKGADFHALLECSADVEFQPGDVVLDGDTEWKFIGVMGRDRHLQTVSLKRTRRDQVATTQRR